MRTDNSQEQYIESTVVDVQAAFELLETTLLKKSDELNNACRSIFEKVKQHLKVQKSDSFYSKEVRSKFRISYSSMQRYLCDLAL